MAFQDQYPIVQVIQLDDEGNQIAPAIDGNLYMVASKDRETIELLENILVELRLLRMHAEVATCEEFTKGDLDG